jgi:hypothetical protein
MSFSPVCTATSRLKLLLPLVLVIGATGCVYTDVRVPLDTDVSTTQLGPKQGQASLQSVLWLVAWGDAGTAAAARNGGIQVINHMDQHVQSYVFGLYTKQTTLVYGEQRFHPWTF